MADIDYAGLAQQWRDLAAVSANKPKAAEACRIAAAVMSERAIGADHAPLTSEEEAVNTVLDRIIAARDEQARAEEGAVAGNRSAYQAPKDEITAAKAGISHDTLKGHLPTSAAPLPDEWSCPECDELGALCHRHLPPPAAVPDGDTGPRCAPTVNRSPGPPGLGSPSGTREGLLPHSSTEATSERVPDGDRVSLGTVTLTKELAEAWASHCEDMARAIRQALRGRWGGEPMSQYRKKPVTVEAFQWDGLRPGRGVVFDPDLGGYHVVTIHGQVTHISPGDWIVAEPDGQHFYPVRPDIFEATYEPV